MINPLPSAILATVIESIDKVLRPGLEGRLARATPETISEDKLHLSVVITIRHMLRLAALRIDGDPARLREETALASAALAQVATFLATVEGDDASVLLADVETALRDKHDASVTDAAALYVGRLRSAITLALRWLTAHRTSLGDRPGYPECRSIIRDYLAWQITTESALVDAVLEGPDFRR